MTLPRRRRPLPHERQATVNDAMVPGAFRGRLPGVAPVVGKKRLEARARGITAVTDVTSVSFDNEDIFDLASAGAQIKTLAFLPIERSVHVELNGVKARKGTDWTVSGQTLSLLTPLDCQVGDVLTVEYAYLTGVPTSVAASTFRDFVLSLNPLAYYRLGDVSNGGVLADSSGNSHTGTYGAVSSHTATAGLLTGDSDQAMLMTGAGGEGASVSYGSWMNHTSMSWIGLINTGDAQARLVARESTSYAWSVQLAGGQVRFGANGVVIVDGPTAVNNGVKHLFGVTYDGTTVRIYVDGGLDTSLVWAGPLPTPSGSDITIGYGGGTGAGQMFSGTLDEVAIFGTALSAAQMSQLWDAT